MRSWKKLKELRNCFQFLVWKPREADRSGSAVSYRKQMAMIAAASASLIPLTSLTPEKHQYSPHALMSMSSRLTLQKAWINALARRLFVINGTLRSMAARRIL